MASCRGDPPPPLTEEKLEVSKFYRRRAPDSFIVVKEIQGGFNLEGIERDIIMTYISPKFKFDELPEKEYHFRVQTPHTYVSVYSNAIIPRLQFHSPFLFIVKQLLNTIKSTCSMICYQKTSRYAPMCNFIDLLV